MDKQTKSDKRREHNRKYYQNHTEKWLGEGGYSSSGPLKPLIFVAKHSSGVIYVGATRSLKGYLNGAFIRKTLNSIGHIKEWNIEIYETLPPETTLMELRQRARDVAEKINGLFLKPGELKKDM
jgi:F0F1-type ATP synthase gamma subunit